MTPPFLSIVIPAYNEEQRLRLTLERIAAFLSARDYSWEVVVADDGSVDATGSIVADFAAEWPQIRLLSLPHRGKGGAVKAGMLAAAGEYRFLCDADLSMSIDQVEGFLPPQLLGVDIAIGSRRTPGSRRIDEPLGRYCTSRLYNCLIQWLLLPGIRDTQCGFKVFRGAAAEELFRQQQNESFAFDLEILYLGRRWGLTLREVAIDWEHRSGSKVRLRDGLGLLWDLLKIRRRLLNAARPAALSEKAE